MNQPTSETLSFDLRRNLIQILGEEHYPHAEHLYHELAANAFDADATRVDFEEIPRPTPATAKPTPPYSLRVMDDGNGMDLEGLRQYFTVGESRKRGGARSESRQRKVIGHLGVGKVAILKVARSWTITTERHLDVEAPVRLQVRVDIDDWINGRVEAFEVERLEPIGRQGTELLLDGVNVDMRLDRILRHIQRLPLSDEFQVYRNGVLIPPRQWTGVRRIDVSERASWKDRDGQVHHGDINGEVWIRPPKDQTGFIDEPPTEDVGLKREPAGIEVRVNGSVVTHEFFGRETHGHGVNRIWGYVNADWLPIVGNRTDYQRDHPAGAAFFETMKPIMDDVYRAVRKENEGKKARGESGDGSGTDQTASDQTTASGSESERDHDGAKAQPGAEEAPAPIDPIKRLNESTASRYAQAISELLESKPEVLPVPMVESPARSGRGRPAKDRLYPARRHPQERERPFQADELGTDWGLLSKEEGVQVARPARGVFVPRAVGEARPVPELEVKVNTPSGIRLRFESLGPVEGLYRWVEHEKAAELSLDINTDHQLYRAAGRPGSDVHRLYSSWVIALALAEHSRPVGGQALAEELETVTYEIFEALATGV